MIRSTCAVCGKQMITQRSTKRMCSATCRNKLFYQRRADLDLEQQNGALQDAVVIASSELDQLRQENDLLKIDNEQLKRQIEQWKESIKKHNDRIDRLEEIIDKRDGDIDTLKKEIGHLKLERRAIDRERTKKSATFVRDHLERVLHSEIRRQFPNDTIIQEHIGAIRAFNASYINALVTA